MLSDLAGALLDQVPALAPVLAPIALLMLGLAMPMPGRGPRPFQRRDPWRGFKYAPRRTVFARAQGRCEGARFVVWGRCPAPVTEADHIYPWSRSGPTVVSNGQALCRSHNRSKSNLRPPWWYVRGLERRRAAYFPADADPRVLARMTDADRAARQGHPLQRRR